MLRALFLNPPSYQGFDGGPGARYQARREIRSYWYPAWPAQPAAIAPGNQQVPHGVTKDVRADRARRFAAGCRDLGITGHGTFILGLPGKTRETIRKVTGPEPVS